MDKVESFQTPKCDGEKSEGLKPGAVLIVSTIVVSVLLAMIMGGRVGNIIGSQIPAAVIVLLFQIGKRFRNSKSRWKIYLWSQVLVLLGQLASFV